jgi:antagonist of KipI
MSLRVLRAGMLTTVQDLGRTGFQQYGVIVSGVMDPHSLRIANLLVGNPQQAAGLEITLMGPTLLFEQDALIAITGADLSPRINQQLVPAWRPVWVRAGSQLDFGALRFGCRACLAIAGGIDVPLVMNSRSTCLPAQLGGYRGRSLLIDDSLPVGSASPQAIRRIRQLVEAASDQSMSSVTWFAGMDLTNYAKEPTIRVIPGSQYDWFTAASQKTFFSETFCISPQSDRMGFRLSGPLLQQQKPRELVSEAVTFGTIQVPADGHPIILMADRPTTGGYAKIAQVIAVDHPVLAQMKPGSTVRFQAITLEAARQEFHSREAQIDRLRCGIPLN